MNQQEKLNGLGNMYTECLDVLDHFLGQGREETKKKLARTIHDLNINSKKSKLSPLETVIFTGPSQLAKKRSIQAIAQFLLGKSDALTHIDCQQTSSINPLDLSYIITNENKQKYYYSPFHPKNLIKPRQQGNKNDHLHKISQKHPGLSIIYLDNFNHLDPKIQEKFLESTHTKGILNKSILFIGYDPHIEQKNTKKKPITVTGFGGQSYTPKTYPRSLHPFLEYYDFLEFGALDETTAHKIVEALTVEHLNDLMQKNEYQKTIINITNQLLESFQQEYLSPTTLTEEKISQERHKNFKPLLSSFLQNNKHQLQDPTKDPTQITLSLQGKGAQQQIIGITSSLDSTTNE